jgi:glycosyltransferase involved in cell wall biosynthesis
MGYRRFGGSGDVRQHPSGISRHSPTDRLTSRLATTEDSSLPTRRPLVSVITPTLNAGQYLSETMMSIRQQDYMLIEHVVVDGGSTDDTVAIAQSDPDVVLAIAPHSGQAEALNVGFRTSRGDIVAWLNADDLYLPGAVRKAVDALVVNPLAGMVYANYVEIDEKGEEVRRAVSAPFSLDAMLNRGNQVPQPTVFMRRAVLDEVGFVNPELHYAMDYDLWIRIGQARPVVHVDDYWAAFRIHARSKSGMRAGGFYTEMRKISKANGGRRLSAMWVHHHSGRFQRAGRALLRADFRYVLQCAKGLLVRSRELQ